MPFAITTTVGALIGFFINLTYPFTVPIATTLTKYACVFSMVWWFTIGQYIVISQISGGLGDFGRFSVPAYGEAQAFFKPVNVIVLLVGTTQACIDWLNFKVLALIERGSGGADKLSWIEQHKWGVFVFSYQAIVIFAVFIAYFPFCLWDGWASWTCISTPLLAIPVIVVLFIPLYPQMPWAFRFIKKMAPWKLPAVDAAAAAAAAADAAVTHDSAVLLAAKN